ncbi:cinnamoyl-CoA reductase 1-like [Chenopodium quinoa]|uniref:cinnamoyl-CoA reductase 1-like n=1 Tax=Chenopodium quinoa TaxID=63459 RepID=UPI000B794BCD|nr:cinnamoyl-CoA reductase 1-like [Chenopodium quinoa]
MSGHGQVVCVTGASGFIASWLVKLLLLRRYTVHATVRNPNDQTKVEHLLGLEGAKERLHLFKADLMEEGSFDSAISGCHGVFHTASPVLFTVNDPQADVLDPAIKGTLNVLTSCKKFSTVRRVVLTSSMSAVLFTGKPRAPEVVVDESWFSDTELCKESSMMWYTISKTLAEDTAWKFAKENSIDLISMNPGMVIGPMLQLTLNATVAPILNLINGAKTFPNAAFGLVHVKDVATAHILAFEIPSASGRYLLVETVAHYSEIVRILQELYPSLSLPDKCADDKPFAPTYQVSKEKVKSLGIDYTPFKETLKGTVENLKEKGFARFDSQ